MGFALAQGLVVSVSVFLFALGPTWAAGQQANQPVLGRTVYGVVSNAQGEPLPAAVVYLTSRRTKAIQTEIADDRGAYSFHQLEPNVTYDVYAVWHQHRSAIRTDSEYESDPTVRLDLKISGQ